MLTHDLKQHFTASIKPLQFPLNALLLGLEYPLKWLVAQGEV
jgi:hypothetical protein